MLLYFWLLLNRIVKTREETTLRRERGRGSTEDWSWDLTSGREVQLCMSLLQAMHWHSYAKLFLHNYANNHTRKWKRERKTKAAMWFGGIFFPFETWLLQPQSYFIERKYVFAETMLASVCSCQNWSNHSTPLSKWKNGASCKRTKKPHYIQTSVKMILISTFTSCYHWATSGKIHMQYSLSIALHFGNAPNSQQLFCGCNPPFPLAFHMTSFA